MKNPDMCLAHCVRRADRVVSQLYNDHLAPLGIRITQFSIMRALHLLESTTARQLQEVLVMDQTTVSRALKPLIRDGYIHTGAGANKREKALSLTKEGEELYLAAQTPWKAAQKQLKKKLGKGQDQLLVELSQLIVSLKQ
ncbi:winged helix DNA-binding protein [Pseudomaricurvus alkylphenolicus]|jgi:DNA-binding MarR family transcriptional regulator|uniref:MarR family winged helix-turn-helix transcriptional regulator n=1 Tax=Pseudomaricurvus alkylphenolicus TaxID=1306991 RepID=UPI00141DBA96|nr:winged helix DNA-binding protein [Pseudomaricurvus alkylphenolicus]NIB40569.1 winged helix DNA-binding protein [Pseudomaricurvus alkylphenolicus]